MARERGCVHHDNRGREHPPTSPWRNEHMVLFDPGIPEHIRHNVSILEEIERRRIGDKLWVIRSLVTRHLCDLEQACTHVERQVAESNAYIKT